MVCDHRPEEKAIVIVVDDEALNRAIYAGCVRRLGYKAVEGKNGKEAVTAFREASRSGATVAAIIMDINMPGMDGLEAAWRIRTLEAAAQLCSCQDALVPSLENKNTPGMESLRMVIPDALEGCECSPSRVPIWAVSGCSVQEQANSPAMKLLPPSICGPPWQKAGFDVFLPKPAHQHKLFQLLTSVQVPRDKQDTAQGKNSMGVIDKPSRSWTSQDSTGPACPPQMIDTCSPTVYPTSRRPSFESCS